MRLHDQNRLATLKRYDPPGMERDHGLDSHCNLVRVMLGVPMAAVTLVEDETTHYVGLSGMDLRQSANEHTFCARTIEKDRPMLVEDATKDARFEASPFVTTDPGIRFYIGAPLIAPDGSALGALCALDTTSRSCGEVEQAKLASLASTAVDILEMRRHMLEARKLALTDGLTGIANRAGIELEIQKSIAVESRHGLAFGLLYFDVDHFKAVNDQRGHKAGDELLRLIGRTLSDTTRREEVCGRLGGDEFVVLLLGVNQHTGLEAAGRIKAALDEAVSGAGFPVSFSMGLACFPEAPADSETALHAADQLLYEAKRGGKNRIVSAAGDGPASVAEASE
jgi:diguanylate cyclase (GGDEF)-like protein